MHSGAAGSTCAPTESAYVEAIGLRYGATLAWAAIAVVGEEKTCSAFFGTIAQTEDAGERFFIPMKPEQTARY